jgi:hypothetical protein
MSSDRFGSGPIRRTRGLLAVIRIDDAGLLTLAADVSCEKKRGPVTGSLEPLNHCDPSLPVQQTAARCGAVQDRARSLDCSICLLRSSRLRCMPAVSNMAMHRCTWRHNAAMESYRITESAYLPPHMDRTAARATACGDVGQCKFQTPLAWPMRGDGSAK